MMIPNSCQRLFFWSVSACVGAGIVVLILFGNRMILAADDKNVEQIKGDERIAVLRFLAAHNEANYRKIETWRGKYHFIDRFPEKIQLASKQKKPPQQFEERDVIAIREGTVEFALDIAADKLWSEYQEDGSKARFLTLDGKEKITPLKYAPADEKQILTADRLTKLRADIKFGPLPEYSDDPHHMRKTSSRLAQQDNYRVHERISDLVMRLDPRRFYSTNNAYPVYKELSNFADALMGGYGVEERERVSRVLEIDKDGAPGAREYKVTMRFFTRRPEDEQGLQTEIIRFREQNDFLPIEQTYYAKEGGKIHQHRSWIYQRTNGVFIPKEFHITIYSLGSDTLTLDRHLRFVEGVLNEPLSANTFALDHLGLERGDRLEDKVEKKLYVSDGNKLLPAEQFTADTKQPTRNHSSRWFVWLNVGLLSAVLSFWIARWYLRFPKLRGGS